MAKTKTRHAPVGIEKYLGYDPTTGLIFFLRSTHGYGGKKRIGDEAGTPKDGYVQVHFHGTVYRAHRLAWYFMTGDWLPPRQDLDHINGDRSDNRWVNLRLATRSQNNMNVGKLRPDNKSGVRGVSFRKDTQKWHARIYVGGRVILLGDFVEKSDAVAARSIAEKKHFGERLRA